MSTHLSDHRFDEYKLPDSLLQGLKQANFEFCTPIQAQTLPHTLQGQDVAGQAQTGTGKTMAFLIAVYHRLLTQPASEHRKPNQPRALIIAPTRELAIQIHKDAELLGKHAGLKLALVYGGIAYEKQRQQIADGVDILIATPGRLIDYFKQHVFNLKAIQALVLDEADRMFDLGFIDDIRYLLRRCPAPDKRLNMLFSATLSLRVQELAYEHMNSPHTVKIEAQQPTADKIEESVYYPANNEKIPLLLGLFKKFKPTRSIIFVNTKRVAENVYAYLLGNGYPSALLSGDIPQKKRQSLLKKFQDGEFNVLVATDVAARGLHIDNISHVFNYDLPQQAEDYVHRIGRTARAGASGVAISFACEDYAHYMPDIEAYIEHSIPSQPVSSELLITPEPAARIERHRPQRRNNGQRPHKSGHGHKHRHHGSKQGHHSNTKKHKSTSD